MNCGTRLQSHLLIQTLRQSVYLPSQPPFCPVLQPKIHALSLTPLLLQMLCGHAHWPSFRLHPFTLSQEETNALLTPLTVIALQIYLQKTCVIGCVIHQVKGWIKEMWVTHPISSSIRMPTANIRFLSTIIGRILGCTSNITDNNVQIYTG